MKKWILIITAAVLMLSLTACIGAPTNNNAATADEAANVDVSKYNKDFAGLQKYLKDTNADMANATKAEIFYDILGAKDGVRYILNGNAFIEIYDFSDEQNDTAKSILADIKDDGKFTPIEGGAELTALLTKSGKLVIAYDASRAYNYAEKIATDKVKENW